jgi:signal transduction histidine kinase/ActR/RegA family two-component response regulator
MSPDDSAEVAELPEAAETAPRAEAADGARYTARLLVVDGPGRGRRYKIGERATIGRSFGCEVLIEDDEVSRRHAVLTRSADGTFVIEDLGSSNGTALNGAPITRASVRMGDKIRLADKVVLMLASYDADEDVMLQRQRLETVGRLGAGLAHDFNNMQAVVTAGLDFVMRMPGATALNDERVRDALTDIMKASARASELARNLMNYAASDREGYTIVDVSRLCDEVLRFVQRTFERKVTVVSDIAPKLAVIGSSAELHQVLMNLAVNARDAMPNGGELRLRAELCESGAVVGMDVPPGLQHVLITVSDTGVGMDADTQRRIFEPFFTTKSRERGFGLGLSMVRDIAAAHGGTVGLESVPGKGTTFRVCLPPAPSARQRRSASTPSARATPALPDGALVLVVDDEEMVRKTIGRILEGAGCRIAFARDGLEALRTYAEQPRRPDLVVIDLDMPHTSPEEAVGSLLELDPDARILLMSANSAGEREGMARALRAVGFVRKPFDALELVTSVLAAMQAPSGLDEKTTLGREQGQR